MKNCKIRTKISDVRPLYLSSVFCVLSFFIIMFSLYFFLCVCVSLFDFLIVLYFVYLLFLCFFVVLIFPYFLYYSVIFKYLNTFLYYYFPEIPLLCVVFCSAKGTCYIWFSCILCSTYVIWFLWHHLWCYFHTFWFIVSFSIVQHFFPCICSFILFLILSIAFPFTFFLHFYLVEVAMLISICRSFAIFCTFW